MKASEKAIDADADYRRAAGKYSVSHMSDSKWRKLFTALDRAGTHIKMATWRFIDSKHTWEKGLPGEHQLGVVRILDGEFQPTEYKWIESIFVPREYRPYRDVGYTVRQDVDGLVRSLREVGDFMLEEDGEGVTIIGYAGRLMDAG